MKKKIFKIFMLHSYICLACYVGSESALNIARWMNKREKGTKENLKFEWLWKTTFERFKETWKLISEG